MPCKGISSCANGIPYYLAHAASTAAERLINELARVRTPAGLRVFEHARGQLSEGGTDGPGLGGKMETNAQGDCARAAR
jgi:hypothetical protein